jgi:hypothetical protein
MMPYINGYIFRYNKDYIQVKLLPGWSYDLRDMRQIAVYDVASKTWYNVTAEGDIPANRSAFCTSISAAPDDSSMQITMYGGWDLFGAHAFADIYVLSIPSFQWINVTDTANVEFGLNGGNRIGRAEHVCRMHNEREMISVGGGIYFGSQLVNENSCNSSWPVVRTLDVSTYKWTNQFVVSPGDYYVPDAVVKVIGGK